MLTSEVLDLAADLIEERGWDQGPQCMRVGSQRLCLESAIAVASNRATYGSEYFYGRIVGCPATAAVQEYVNAPFGQPWMWNDTVGRTQHEVVAVLRACSAIESAREQQDAAWATYAEVVTA